MTFLANTATALATLVPTATFEAAAGTAWALAAAPFAPRLAPATLEETAANLTALNARLAG